MADCSKRILDLSPVDTVACFLDADIWKQFGANGRRMWDGFITTSNGEWLGAILGFGILPAEFASFILPFIFIGRLVRHFSRDWSVKFNGSEERKRKYATSFMLAASMIAFYINPRDTFMVSLSVWEGICGLVMFMVPLAWWAEPVRLVKAGGDA